jgi:DNA repair exonuclease SbcCD nuclease subunit
VDIQEAYGRAVNAILERDVDLVVHSGDVFDSVRPATHVIIGFLKQTFRITRQATTRRRASAPRPLPWSTRTW